MKKKTNKKEIDNVGYIAQPPWVTAKSKQAAYRVGYNSGLQDGLKQGREEVEQKFRGFNERRENARGQMLQSIATIADAASHALLSFDGKL